MTGHDAVRSDAAVKRLGVKPSQVVDHISGGTTSLDNLHHRCYD